MSGPKYGHPLDIAEAVLRPLTPDEIEDASCRQCGNTMGNDEPGVLEPTLFCHLCAQAALVVLAEFAQGKFIDNKLDRLAANVARTEKMAPFADVFRNIGGGVDPGRPVDLPRTRGPRGARRKR